MNSSLPDFVLKTLAEFNDTVDEQDRNEEERRRMVQELAEAKHRELIPLRMLLKSLTDMGVVVRNSAFQNPDAPAQALHVEEEPSSPTYAPGRSLRLNHPAILEIAIPNQSDQEKMGVVVINCARKHPQAHLLTGPFRNMEAACAALGHFLALNTVGRKRRPTSPLLSGATVASVKPDR
jgi:hypothetical protein